MGTLKGDPAPWWHPEISGHSWLGSLTTLMSTKHLLCAGTLPDAFLSFR